MATPDPQTQFFKSLNIETIDPNEIDKASKAVLAFYKTNPDKLNVEVNSFCKKVAGWIKEHSNSKLLPYAFKIVINLYELLGFYLEFDINDYYKTSEKEDEKDPKTLEKSMLEGFEDDKENFIDNPLLNFDMIHITLSFLDNMMSKKMHLTHKSLLTLILPIISIYSVDRKIQAIIRKKKFLKVLLKIFKDVLQSPGELSDLEIQICCHILHSLAKLTYENRKNQDYLMKKKGYEYLKGVIITSTDMALLQGAVCTFANLCDTVDQRLILWCSGNLPVLIQRCKAATAGVKKSLETKKVTVAQKYLKDVELTLVAVWKFCISTNEVIDDCLRNNDLVKNLSEIFELMKKISPSEAYYNDYIRVLGLVVAVLRRFSVNPTYRTQTIQLFYQYVIQIPSFYSNDLVNSKTNSELSFLFKELSGLMGVLSLDAKISADLVTNGFLQSLIKIAVAYFENPKLIKTILGCLTNICTTDQARDALCHEKELYVLMFNVLDKYDYISFIIDYALKLILNTTPNDTFYKNYASITFLEKLIYLLHCYQFEETISRNLIKILRIICSRIKALENFEKALKNYESANKGFNIVTFLGENMDANTNDPEAVAGVLLFLSNISQNSPTIRNMIRDNQQFSAFLKSYINHIKDDPQAFKIVSTSIAYLPLEEIGEFF